MESKNNLLEELHKAFQEIGKIDEDSLVLQTLIKDFRIADKKYKIIDTHPIFNLAEPI